MNKKKWNKLAVSCMLAGLAATILLTLLGWRYYIRTVEKNEWGELLNAREYSRHYVMIPDESSSNLWQDIYESAKAAAAEQDAYVEFLCDWSAGEYTPVSYVDIAIAAKVDGIIVKPDGTAKMREAINAAEDAGIPVVTVLDDDTDSSRKSFVGINSYQMGTTYGHQVLNCIDESTRRITVLLDSRDSGKDLIFKEMKATIQEELPAEMKERVDIQSLRIAESSMFDAEEIIRDLFNGGQDRPDILVCMNEEYSECAYQAMVDYNQVGDVDIIGYYRSDTMLNAVQKGNVPIAVTLDAEQVGRRSVEALEEYYSMGYTSSYFSVDLDIITKQNVKRFLKEKK
ncbi:MAG: substrate-binding domain-containing protein [Lachnospiraceae bacterium]|nr:substrate-binding domain-containing protein [Lachnospiraceae bacterium]